MGEPSNQSNDRIIINGRFELGPKIHDKEGVRIFQVWDINDWHMSYLMKMQEINRFEKEIQNEISFLRACKGFNEFPTLIDEFMDCENSYIVMTKEGDRTLKNHLVHRGFKFTMENTIRFGRRLFAILEKMHFLGYVHRDVHFMNVMIDHYWDGNIIIKLIDFERTVKIDPPAQCYGMASWHSSLNVAEGGRYTPIDDFISAVFVMMMTQCIDPFGCDRSKFIRMKENFHDYPMNYFKDPSTHWICKLYLELESQRATGYNTFKIQQMFRDAIPGLDIKSPITFHHDDGQVFID